MNELTNGVLRKLYPTPTGFDEFSRREAITFLGNIVQFLTNTENNFLLVSSPEVREKGGFFAKVRETDFEELLPWKVPIVTIMVAPKIAQVVYDRLAKAEDFRHLRIHITPGKYAIDVRGYACKNPWPG